jgi:hypothetical protein
MAHSLGGSSRNGLKISQNPFPGSRQFRYYRDGVAHYVYSNEYLPAKKDPKPRWFLIFIYIPFFIAVFTMFATAIDLPKKPLASYNANNIAIIDTADVFTNEEEHIVLNKLKEFGETTGIPTQIVTINYNEWKNSGTLEQYARYRYYAQFEDENGWLIVYSEENNRYSDWSLEEIHGDNTMKVVNSFFNDFDKAFHSQLLINKDARPCNAFLAAFDKSINIFNNQKTEIDFSMILPALFILAFISIHAYFMIFAGTRKKYSYQELQEVPNSYCDNYDNYDNYDNPENNHPISSSYSQTQPIQNYQPPEETFTCRYCGYEYKNPQDNRCPNCRAIMQ